MKNSADQGGCYPQRPKAEVDNTLRDLQNSSYPTKAEFNNCFIIHSKYFLLLKGVSRSGVPAFRVLVQAFTFSTVHFSDLYLLYVNYNFTCI